MTQLAFLCALFALGMLAGGTLRRRVDPVILCLFAFPLGSALWVIAAEVLLVSGLPYKAPGMHILLGAVALVALTSSLRQGARSRRQALTALAATGLFAATAVLATRY